jgi:O-antigen chain-terminating methyltransferase
VREDQTTRWDDLYAAFEEEFRGTPEEVEERLKYYLPFVKEFNGDSRILDLGSGRGDWLHLLRKEGFKPHAIEVNEVFAERSRNEGFDVTHGDVMVYLDQQPDNSLDLVTAFHLIEHMNADKLFRLLDEIKRTLKPGGKVFIETPSPENIVVAACNFYADPTHHKPVNPHTLILHPIDDGPFRECEGSEQLNLWFYGPRDYSVIARKPW